LLARAWRLQQQQEQQRLLQFPVYEETEKTHDGRQHQPWEK
jgi:hypothetical protein